MICLELILSNLYISYKQVKFRAREVLEVWKGDYVHSEVCTSMWDSSEVS